MYTMEKEYYLKDGRLDLSVLDELKCYKEEIEEESEEKRNEFIHIYKDSQIEEVLKEMGSYFSSL